MTDKKRPNILFLMSDDQGAWAMHCAGNQEIITPSLDRLSREGMRFSQFFCCSPVCSPARASIVTGKMPSAHGIHDWLAGGNIETDRYPYMKNHEHFRKKDHGIEYLKGQTTYIEKLAEAGYWCALSGKWHLGNNAEKKKGFSGWFTIGTGGCHYFNADTTENGRFHKEEQYITDVITDRAPAFLDERPKDAPFYLSVHYTAPHGPWGKQENKQEIWELYQNCKFQSVPEESSHPNQISTCSIGDTPEKRRENLMGYYAAITAMDAGIGKILDYLDVHGLAEETVVIFTSDNGMNMGHHGIWGKGNGTYPPNMYDSSIKVPFLIRAPFLKEQGSVTDRLTRHCDIYPTILELAGLKQETSPKQPGKSFLPFLMGRETEYPGCVAVCDEYGFVRMLRTEHEKLILRYLEGKNEFYDLVEDPEEKNNRINDPVCKERIEIMRKKLEMWFDLYSEEPFSGQTLPVSGRGQTDMCWKENSFVRL